MQTKENSKKTVNVYEVSDWKNKSIAGYSICEKNEYGNWVDMEGNPLCDEEIKSIEEHNIPLKDGEFVAWMVEGNLEMTAFLTKNECLKFRNSAWAGQYKSVAEMDRLIPAVRYIFTGKSGMGYNVPVCPVEERIRRTYWSLFYSSL